MRPVISLLLLGASTAAAQYALSALAGYIHHTEGEVWLGDRAIAPKPQDFEHVLEGRRLRTGRGKAEILLVPGSFVRVGEGSEIEMISSGLTSATVRLVSGSLTVDLQTLFEKDSIAILVNDQAVRFHKTGLYRIDAATGAAPVLRVIDGRARVEGIEVKGGQALAFGSAAPQKRSGGAPDALDEWNSERHEKLAVLAEKTQKERLDGMTEAERDLLRMIIVGPGGSGGASHAPSAPPANPPSRQR